MATRNQANLKPNPKPEAQATTELAQAANTALGEVGDFGDAAAGVGLDTLGREDVAIPFFAILQSSSPECKRSEGAYIDGAQEGMLINTVTRQVIDPAKVEVYVINCGYTKAYVEWKLRENGGGFVKEHKWAEGESLLASTIRDDKSRDVLPNGNQISDTRTFYVLVIGPDGVPGPAVIAMTSTQIKKGKQWLMQLKGLRIKQGGALKVPGIYWSKWRVLTVPESNEKGSWFGWRFDFAGYLQGQTDPLFIEAREFNESIAAGTVKVDMTKAPDGSGASRIDPDTGEVQDREPGSDDGEF